MCIRDRRPDPTVSVVPSPRFVLFVFSSVLFVPVFCPSRQASPLAASPHARGSREFTPPFAALPSRGSRDFMPAVRGSLCRRSRLSHPAVRGSLRRRSRLSHPAVRGTSCRRSRLSDPAVRGSWRRRSRLCHPAVRGSSCRRSRIIQPSVPGGWRLHPRLTLARRPASDSMPAGLPLTQCPPACLWLNARRPASDSSSPGVPLTQARRIAADSSSPDCRWLMPLVVGREGQLTTVCFTPPSAAHQYFTCFYAGKANPPSAVHSARSRLRLPPARRPLPLSGQASRLLPLLSSQPIMVSPAGRCRIDKPAGRGRNWPVSDHGLFNCFCVFSPGGLLIPLSFPKEILGGGSRAPAEETEVGAGAAVSEAVPPWPPELPAPPWPPELPAPPWPPELPAPPWPPELPVPPGPRSVCSTLETPSCVCICVGPVGSPECPPPLPGGTVTARVEPSGRGELC